MFFRVLFLNQSLSLYLRSCNRFWIDSYNNSSFRSSYSSFKAQPSSLDLIRRLKRGQKNIVLLIVSNVTLLDNQSLFRKSVYFVSVLSEFQQEFNHIERERKKYSRALISSQRKALYWNLVVNSLQKRLKTIERKFLISLSYSVIYLLNSHQTTMCDQ